jgi:hypothetical protein
MTEEPRYVSPPRSPLERLLGGRPGAVALRLVLLSLAVGFVMTMFGLDVRDIVRGGIDMVEAALRDGTGILGDIARYVLTGAAIVVPIWLIMRLTRSR